MNSPLIIQLTHLKPRLKDDRAARLSTILPQQVNFPIFSKAHAK